MRPLLFFLFLAVPFHFLSSEEDLELSISKPEQILSNPYSLANFESPASTLIHDCVNVLTGDYIDSQVDLVLEGSEPIHLKRHYCSSVTKGGSLYGGWNHSLWGMALRKKTNRHNLAVTKGGQGGEYLYKAARGNPLFIHPEMLKKGLTNCAAGKISGKTNVKNNKLCFANKQAELKTGDGNTHLYAKSSTGRYLLKKVIKPNGFRHRYHYHDKKETLNHFYIQNNVGRVTNSIDMTPLQKVDSSTWTLTASTPDKRQVIYTFLNMKCLVTPPLLVSVEKSNGPRESFNYEFLKGPRVSGKSWPGKRYLNIHYAKVEKDIKVESLTAPAGKNGEEIPIYRFEYKNEDSIGQTFVCLGRMLKMIYPDGSSSSYTYLGPRLKTVSRKLYEHRYIDFDLSGNVVSAQLAGKCGVLSYEYNLLNQPTLISSSRWKEEITAYDPAGNILEKRLQDGFGDAKYQYLYDDLYQLTEEKHLYPPEGISWEI